MGEDGAQIEQRLSWMLVHAVAGVEDREAGFGLQQPGRARRVVAQDDGFRSESPQREAGVFKRLALFDAGAEAGNQRSVGTQAFGSQFKARPGARRGLVEKKGNAALGEDAVPDQRVFFFQDRGGVENLSDALLAHVEN